MKACRRARIAAVAALTCGAVAAATSGWDAPTSQPASQPSASTQLVAAYQLVFRAALERIAPVIVRIETIGGAQPVEPKTPDGQPAPRGFVQADGPTTGVIWSADGHILTSSFNFMRDPTIITVRLADGRRFVATLVARDRHARLALLKIDAHDLPTPELVPPHQLRPGQWSLAAGLGHGSAAPTLSVGIISALNRASGMAVQTDAKLSPANYGGPLIDIDGRVIGICVPIGENEDDELAGLDWYDSGVAFAIHTDHIALRLPRLMRGENLQRGLLGLSLSSGEAVVGAQPESIAAPPGVKVLGEPAGPAASAGIQNGDIILSLDNRPTPRLLELRRALARRAAGDAVDIQLWRAGAVLHLNSRLVTSDEIAPQHPIPDVFPPADSQPADRQHD